MYKGLVPEDTNFNTINLIDTYFCYDSYDTIEQKHPNLDHY